MARHVGRGVPAEGRRHVAGGLWCVGVALLALVGLGRALLAQGAAIHVHCGECPVVRETDGACVFRNETLVVYDCLTATSTTCVVAGETEESDVIVGMDATVATSNGTCQLVFEATGGRVHVQEGALVTARAVSMMAHSVWIDADASIVTSGLGPRGGPGFGGGAGSGGSYGGSGADQTVCSSEVYSLHDSPIGVVNVASDILRYGYNNPRNPTFGSGGGGSVTAADDDDSDGDDNNRKRRTSSAAGNADDDAEDEKDDDDINVYEEAEESAQQDDDLSALATLLLEAMSEVGDDATTAGIGPASMRRTGRIGEETEPWLREEWTRALASASTVGRGGGRILINATGDVNITGLLEANGGDASGTDTIIGAGSGGSVTVLCYHLRGEGEIHANGGTAAVESGSVVAAGGGGGRIMLEYTKAQSVPTTMISGGSSSDNSDCRQGGAGTRYLSSPDETSLRLNNDDVETSAATLVELSDHIQNALTTLTVQQFAVLAAESIVAPNAMATVVSSGMLSSPPVGSLNGSATSSTGILLRVQSITVQSGLVTGGPVALFATDGTLQLQSSTITFTGTCNLTASEAVMLSSTITTTQGDVHVSAGGTLTVATDATLTASAVYLVGTSEVIMDGTIFAAPQVCGICVPHTMNLCPRSTEQLANYTAAVVAYDGGSNHDGTVSVTGRITAGSILFCADEVEVDRSAVVQANGLGCASQSGTGAGGDEVATPGGGGGGGYAGRGGDAEPPNGGTGGVSYFNESKSHRSVCTGSGGGGPAGGNGGGLISMVAFETLTVASSIAADGMPGAEIAPDSSGGGGSGGSIAITADTILSTSEAVVLSAHGGAGNAALGGGGGGGGVLSFKAIAPSSSNPFQIDAMLSVKGGTSGYEAGANGSVVWPECPPGYGNDHETLELCQVCPKGTYQYNTSALPCTQCDNKPSHSHYTGTGGKKKDCSYSCDAGYQGSDCKNAIEFIIDELGGTGVFALVLASIYFAVVLTIVLCRMYNEKRYKERSIWTAMNKNTQPEISPSRMQSAEEDDDIDFRLQRDAHKSGDSGRSSYADSIGALLGFRARGRGSGMTAVTEDTPQTESPGGAAGVLARFGVLDESEESVASSRAGYAAGYTNSGGRGTTHHRRAVAAAASQHRNNRRRGEVGDSDDSSARQAREEQSKQLREALLEVPRTSKTRYTDSERGNLHIFEWTRPGRNAGTSRVRSDGMVDKSGSGKNPADSISRAQFRAMLEHLRLKPKDLPRHMTRIYLMGRNSPHAYMGGQWFLPRVLPSRLVHTVGEIEYTAFATRVNELLAWSWYDIILYCTMSFLAFPTAQRWLTLQRWKRIQRLVFYVATYDHAMFTAQRARGLEDSLRLGVASDGTLAYLDFLAGDVPNPHIGGGGAGASAGGFSVTSFGKDRGTYRPPPPHATSDPTCERHDTLPPPPAAGISTGGRNRFFASKQGAVPSPLQYADRRSGLHSVPSLDSAGTRGRTSMFSSQLVGQPHLPICLRLAGRGSYSSPWHVDTRDVLLHQVAEVDGLAREVHAEWFDFIAELNMHLRVLHINAIEAGLREVLEFLHDTNSSRRLAGLKVELCVMPNRDEFATGRAAERDLLNLWTGQPGSCARFLKTFGIDPHTMDALDLSSMDMRDSEFWSDAETLGSGVASHQPNAYRGSHNRVRTRTGGNGDVSDSTIETHGSDPAPKDGRNSQGSQTPATTAAKRKPTSSASRSKQQRLSKKSVSNTKSSPRGRGSKDQAQRPGRAHRPTPASSNELGTPVVDLSGRQADLLASIQTNPSGSIDSKQSTPPLHPRAAGAPPPAHGNGNTHAQQQRQRQQQQQQQPRDPATYVGFDERGASTRYDVGLTGDASGHRDISELSATDIAAVMASAGLAPKGGPQSATGPGTASGAGPAAVRPLSTATLSPTVQHSADQNGGGANDEHQLALPAPQAQGMSADSEQGTPQKSIANTMLDAFLRDRNESRSRSRSHSKDDESGPYADNAGLVADTYTSGDDDPAESAGAAARQFRTVGGHDHVMHNQSAQEQGGDGDLSEGSDIGGARHVLEDGDYDDDGDNDDDDDVEGGGSRGHGSDDSDYGEHPPDGFDDAMHDDDHETDGRGDEADDDHTVGGDFRSSGSVSTFQKESQRCSLESGEGLSPSRHKRDLSTISNASGTLANAGWSSPHQRRHHLHDEDAADQALFEEHSSGGSDSDSLRDTYRHHPIAHPSHSSHGALTDLYTSSSTADTGTGQRLRLVLQRSARWREYNYLIEIITSRSGSLGIVIRWASGLSNAPSAVQARRRGGSSGSRGGRGHLSRQKDSTKSSRHQNKHHGGTAAAGASGPSKDEHQRVLEKYVRLVQSLDDPQAQNPTLTGFDAGGTMMVDDDEDDEDEADLEAGDQRAQHLDVSSALVYPTQILRWRYLAPFFQRTSMREILGRCLNRNSVAPRSPVVNHAVLLGLIALVAADVVVTLIMLGEMYCVKRLGDECNHGIFAMLFLVYPPGAVIFAPISGIVAMSLSRVSLTRSYSTWNRLSLIPAFEMLLFTFAFHATFDYRAQLLATGLLCLKLLQATFVNMHIAATEMQRWRTDWWELTKEETAHLGGRSD